MVERTLTLDELKAGSLDELLQDVADQRATVIVRLPDGKEVMIEPKSSLKPLPVLSGRLPDGWKDAVYGEE